MSRPTYAGEVTELSDHVGNPSRCPHDSLTHSQWQGEDLNFTRNRLVPTLAPTVDDSRCLACISSAIPLGGSSTYASPSCNRLGFLGQLSLSAHSSARLPRLGWFAYQRLDCQPTRFTSSRARSRPVYSVVFQRSVIILQSRYRSCQPVHLWVATYARAITGD